MSDENNKANTPQPVPAVYDPKHYPEGARIADEHMRRARAQPAPDLAAIRARLAADRDSRDYPLGGDARCSLCDGEGTGETTARRTLLEHAPADLAALCDEVERLTADVVALKKHNNEALSLCQRFTDQLGRANDHCDKVMKHRDEALSLCQRFTDQLGRANDRCDKVMKERDALQAEIVVSNDVIATLRAENARLTRACVEGLPREVIACPECGEKHIEGPRRDDPSIDGRVRPHHTHRCYHCGHVWDAGRWSYGDDLPSVAVPIAEHENEVDELTKANRELFSERYAAIEEAKALREILAGRTTPPTDAEIMAHAATDGARWKGAIDGDVVYLSRFLSAEVRAVPGVRWWAVDETDTPCKWPVVTP